MKAFIRFLALSLTVFLLVCCSGNSDERNAAAPAQSIVTPLSKPTPALTPEPTPEPVPTAEPEPAPHDDPEPEPEYLGEPEATPAPVIGIESYRIAYQSCRVYRDMAGQAWVQAIMQISNDGEVPLSMGTVSADLTNEEGALVATVRYASLYPDLLQPGEDALMVDEFVLDEDPGVDELSMDPQLSIKKVELDGTFLAVNDTELKEGPLMGRPMLIGRVENNSLEIQDLICVIVNLYDAEHRGIGQLSATVTEELQVGASIDFTCSDLFAPEDLLLESVASYEVFAFPMQFGF